MLKFARKVALTVRSISQSCESLRTSLECDGLPSLCYSATLKGTQLLSNLVANIPRGHCDKATAGRRTPKNAFTLLVPSYDTPRTSSK
jgi:hypothetical protein